MGLTSHRNGVVVGRFQPLHNGHLDYILKTLEKADHVYIGITTPSDVPTKYEPKDERRLGRSNNPFTYEERVTMISAALDDAMVPISRYTFVHFNPTKVDDWYAAVPKGATYYLILLKDDNNKVQEMESHGLKVEVLDTMDERDHMAGDIRQRIMNDEPWEDLVPTTVANYLKKIGVRGRLLSLRGTKQSHRLALSGKGMRLPRRSSSQ